MPYDDARGQFLLGLGSFRLLASRVFKLVTRFSSKRSSLGSFQRRFSTFPILLPVFLLYNDKKQSFELVVGVPSYHLLSRGIVHEGFIFSHTAQRPRASSVKLTYFNNFQTMIAKMIPLWLLHPAGKECCFQWCL